MLRLTGTRTEEYCRDAPVEAAAEDLPARPLWRSEFPRPTIVGSAPPNTLVTRLACFGRLNLAEVDGLTRLSCNPKRQRAEQVLVHEGSRSDYVHLLVHGFACRYKLLSNGRRQILGYLIPGDLCDVHFTVFNRPDHSVACLTESEVVKIPLQAVTDLIAQFPNIGRALSLAAVIDNAILREWLLNVGQRNAMQKLCHLFCEMSVRLKAIGHVAADGSFELPIIQATMADTTGLTSVHINRTLQRLRCEGLISLRQRRLTIPDFARLKSVAGFDEAYLHAQDHAD